MSVRMFKEFKECLEDHNKHVRQVLETLKKGKLYADPEVCVCLQ